MTEKVKSNLQKLLEELGWKFLTNIGKPNDLPANHEEAMYLKSLRKKYDSVSICEAFDIEGNPLDYMRAVYVR